MLAYSGDAAIACCVCKKIKLDNGMFLRFDDLSNEDFATFCQKHAKMLVSHTYCEACYAIVKEELRRMKEKKLEEEHMNSGLPNCFPKQEEPKKEGYDPEHDHSCDSC